MSLQEDLEARLDAVDGGPGLKGKATNSFLEGRAQSNSPLQGNLDSYGRPLQGNLDASGTALQGAADSNGPMNLSAVNDPDGQELQIDWDRWRNTLTQAIQAGTINKINVHNEANFVLDPQKNMMVSRYPLGISTWYSIDVLPNRQIINIKMTQSSGYPTYDQAVFQSIMDLQGSPILPYPQGSKRQIVNQTGSVQTAAQNHFQNFKFGDREKQQY
ncbi:MAG: energy transducer TonB [Candidatus Obscuribacterales bacterium]|nr:energy transducer TonB [Candidatus Obscuribacterales bacterium]